MARARGPSRRPAPTSRTPDLAARAAPWAGLLVLLAATALAYAPSLPGPFVLDDWGSIQANMRLRRPDALRVPSLAEMLSISRPVTELTFAADYRAAGLDPVRFHAVGLGLHLAATLLAYAFLASLLRRAGHARPRGVALVVAGLFALHPSRPRRSPTRHSARRCWPRSSTCSRSSSSTAPRPDGERGGRRPPGPGAQSVAARHGGEVHRHQPSRRLRRRSGGGGARVGAGRPGPAAARAGLPLVAPLLALAAWSASLHFRSFEADPGGGAGFAATPLSAERLLPDPVAGPVALSRAPRLAALPRLRPILRAQPGAGRRGPPGRGRRAGARRARGLALDPGRACAGRPAGRASRRLRHPLLVRRPLPDLLLRARERPGGGAPRLPGFARPLPGRDHRGRRPPSPLAPRSTGGRRERAVASLVLLSGARARLPGPGLGLGGGALARGRHDVAGQPAAPGSTWPSRFASGETSTGPRASYLRAWTVVRQPARIAALSRNHASLLIDTGRPAEALGVLDRGLAVSPDDPALRGQPGGGAREARTPGGGPPEARRAAAAAPGDPLMRNLLGQAFAVNRDWASALNEFRAAQAIDPGVQLYAVAVGVSLGELGRRDEACAALRNAAARFKERPLPLDATARAAALGCPLPGPLMPSDAPLPRCSRLPAPLRSTTPRCSTASSPGSISAGLTLYPAQEEAILELLEASTSSSTRPPARASRWWPSSSTSRPWPGASAPSTPARSRRW